jgi:hypothetical protein
MQKALPGEQFAEAEVVVLPGTWIAGSNEFPDGSADAAARVAEETEGPAPSVFEQPSSSRERIISK